MKMAGLTELIENTLLGETDGRLAALEKTDARKTKAAGKWDCVFSPLPVVAYRLKQAGQQGTER